MSISLRDQVIEVLKTVFDPEIPVNIVDLGLIYDCRVLEQPEGDFRVEIKMTLTAPGCGMGQVIVDDVKKFGIFLESRRSFLIKPALELFFHANFAGFHNDTPQIATPFTSHTADGQRLVSARGGNRLTGPASIPLSNEPCLYEPCLYMRPSL